MKYVLLACVLLATTAGCDNVTIGRPEQKVAELACDLPVSLRVQNWTSRDGSGSCTHASVVMLLRWQNRPHTANWWRKNHSGGEYFESLCAKLDDAGIRYVATCDENNTEFLTWAIETRRGAMVTVMAGRHAVLLCDLTPTHAAICDNNQPEVVQWIDREAFLREWELSGSWALTPVYQPVPGLP